MQVISLHIFSKSRISVSNGYFFNLTRWVAQMINITHRMIKLKGNIHFNQVSCENWRCKFWDSKNSGKSTWMHIFKKFFQHIITNNIPHMCTKNFFEIPKFRSRYWKVAMTFNHHRCLSWIKSCGNEVLYAYFEIYQLHLSVCLSICLSLQIWVFLVQTSSGISK